MLDTHPGITCGHCSTREHKIKHASTQAVRECGEAHRRVTQTLDVERPARPLLRDQIRQDMARIAAHLPPLHGDVVYGKGDTRTAGPKRPVTQTLDGESVPAARYAIGPVDDTRFYRVDKPTEGRWAGYTFVKVQASDELHPIRNRSERDRILAEIAKDPREAMLRYGREIGACGHCGRTLTNPASRAAGIGDICASKA